MGQAAIRELVQPIHSFVVAWAPTDSRYPVPRTVTLLRMEQDGDVLVLTQAGRTEPTWFLPGHFVTLMDRTEPHMHSAAYFHEPAVIEVWETVGGEPVLRLVLVAHHPSEALGAAIIRLYANHSYEWTKCAEETAA